MTGSDRLRRQRDRVAFGTEIVRDGVLFRLWAPYCEEVLLDLPGDGVTHRRMTRDERGWHTLHVNGAGAGTLYGFRMPDGSRVPDPASRHQPQDVHGPSEVIDPQAYRWGDSDWKGREWEDCVAYELHVGTFTPEGTFRAAASRLPELAELGVTAVSLMPVADFPGRCNWGYDGALLFAPDATYGRPDDFRAFVDAAHRRGLMVFLDVVYNHLGPEGNYLAGYSPLFTDAHDTPWGAAINYDADGSEHVRALICQNAAHWIAEYHIDGLRLDAVHAIRDGSGLHILEEIAEAARNAAPHRLVHLVLENEENSVTLLKRDAADRPLLFTAQWNDDLHHALHVAATGEGAGYYADYKGRTDFLGRTLAEGFAFQGETMSYRGTVRGQPSAGMTPTAFVSFIQNHDQVGNRAFGDRLASIAPEPAVRAVAAIYLLAPQIPMIFMGEEWGSRRPFQFFSDFEPDLAEKVREGRRAEFARFPEFASAAMRESIPDPNAIETFLSSKLDWDEAASESGAAWRAWYRRLLAIRRAEIVPHLRGLRHGGAYAVLGPGAVRVGWTLSEGSELTLEANLNADALEVDRPAGGRVLWTEGEADRRRLGPWTVIWSLGDPQ